MNPLKHAVKQYFNNKSPRAARRKLNVSRDSSHHHIPSPERHQQNTTAEHLHSRRQSQKAQGEAFIYVSEYPTIALPKIQEPGYFSASSETPSSSHTSQTPSREGSATCVELSSSPKRTAAGQQVLLSDSCMIGVLCGKRTAPFPNTEHQSPVDSCHIHSFAPLKRPRKEKMFQLLDLSEDILVGIMTHVMTPAKEGSRKIITEESIRASLPLATTCHALYDVWKHSMHDLELWVSGKLDDRGLESICKGNGRGIHRLGLRRCKHISQRAFSQIPRQCSRLRSLDMSHTDVEDEFVLDLTKSTGRSLQFLALHGCNKLSARSIRAIADRCPHLRFLDIGSIPAVDDNAIGYLVARLGKSIRTMVLSNCANLSDFGMATIGMECKSLMSLTLRGLSSITDNGLHKLCSGIGERVQILDVLDCTGLTMGGYFATVESFCPHVFKYLEESHYVEHLGERCLRDNIIATMPGLIYRISATDAIRRLPALYFLLLDESTLRPFRVSVQSKSLNLSDFGTVLISNFGKKPTPKTKNVLLTRFGYDSPFDSESDDEPCERM